MGKASEFNTLEKESITGSINFLNFLEYITINTFINLHVYSRMRNFCIFVYEYGEVLWWLLLVFSGSKWADQIESDVTWYAAF